MNMVQAEILLLRVFRIWLRLPGEFEVTTLIDPLQLLGLLQACTWGMRHLQMMDCPWWLIVTLLDIQGRWPPLAGGTVIEMGGQEFLVIDIDHWLLRLVSMIGFPQRYPSVYRGTLFLFVNITKGFVSNFLKFEHLLSCVIVKPWLGMLVYLQHLSKFLPM